MDLQRQRHLLMKSDVSRLGLRVSVHVLCSDSIFSFHFTFFSFSHSIWINIAVLKPLSQRCHLQLKEKEIMEEGSKKNNSPRTSTIRRRSSSRRASQSSFINVAEARREVASALNLHRSSSSPYSPSASSRRSSYNYKYGISKATVAGPQYCCYSLLETLPLPEPTWSTTPPAIFAAPSIVATPPLLEAIEFEWEESFTTSYAWWLGFLKSLDGKSTEESKYPFEENVVMRNSWLFGQRQDGPKLGESPCLDANDQSSYLDEWLMIPPTEDVSEMKNHGENVVG